MTSRRKENNTMTSKEMLQDGMSAAEISAQILKEDQERMAKVEQLAKEMGITIKKALSLIKTRQRAKEYRLAQQELSKKMTEIFEKDASYRRVLGS